MYSHALWRLKKIKRKKEKKTEKIESQSSKVSECLQLVMYHAKPTQRQIQHKIFPRQVKELKPTFQKWNEVLNFL